MTQIQSMKLSDQAMGAIMMALQRSLLEQSDIVPVLKSLKLVPNSDQELVVLNPPIVKAITPENLSQDTTEAK
tara:strand:- start:830 stop:1048 length:219 start_codon:yes stop_codon:yes gene_type:complete